MLTLHRIMSLLLCLLMLYVYSASEIPEYRLPWRAVRWEIEQMVEHGRGGVRLEYGRRLYSPSAGGGRPGDMTLKVCAFIYHFGYGYNNQMSMLFE